MSGRLAFYDQKILAVLCPIGTRYTMCLSPEKTKGGKFCNVGPYRQKSTCFSPEIRTTTTNTSRIFNSTSLYTKQYHGFLTENIISRHKQK
jgi:hypothetical protein